MITHIDHIRNLKAFFEKNPQHKAPEEMVDLKQKLDEEEYV